jgi:hypothetical protein
LFSVAHVHVLGPTVEDADALLIVIGDVDPTSESGAKDHSPNLINDHLVALISLVVCANVRSFLDFQRGYQMLVLFI